MCDWMNEDWKKIIYWGKSDDLECCSEHADANLPILVSIAFYKGLSSKIKHIRQPCAHVAFHTML